MGLIITLLFFQQCIKIMLRLFLQSSVIVYVNNIIIYSCSLNKHLKHLQDVLECLTNLGLTLQALKCHFAYASIKALSHCVSRLGLTIDDEKIKIVKNMELSWTLSDLKTGLGFFNYYYQYMKGFSYITQPLKDLKTCLLRGVLVKGRPCKKHASNTKLELDDTCIDTWDILKYILTSALPCILPDFKQPFQLYINGSKEFRFSITLYQVNPDGKECLILFLSKQLLSTK